MGIYLMKVASSASGYSVKDVIARVIRRLRVYGVLLACSLSLGFAVALRHHTNAAVCSLVMAKLDATRGPLARELMLGEETVVSAITHKLNLDLAAVGMSGGLTLKSYEDFHEGEQASCKVGFLSVQILYPLIFAGDNLGTILGSPYYFPGPSFWVMVGITLLGITLIFHAAIRTVGDEVERTSCSGESSFQRPSPTCRYSTSE